MDLYANCKQLQSSSYELMDTEEDQDSEEDDSEEELKKDEYINLLLQIAFFSELSKAEFSNRQFSWKLEAFDILLPPPELV